MGNAEGAEKGRGSREGNREHVEKCWEVKRRYKKGTERKGVKKAK